MAHEIEAENLRITKRLKQTVANGLAGLRELFTMSSQPDRRREQRTTFSGPIIVHTASGIHYYGVCRDLSGRGVGALVSGPLEIGQQVRIEFKHPTLGEQMACATVRQRHGYRYGFAFTDAFHKNA